MISCNGEIYLPYFLSANLKEWLPGKRFAPIFRTLRNLSILNDLKNWGNVEGMYGPESRRCE